MKQEPRIYFNLALLARSNSGEQRLSCDSYYIYICISSVQSSIVITSLGEDGAECFAGIVCLQFEPPHDKAQRRLRSAWAFPQYDYSSLYAQWVAKDPSFLNADSKDSDQTGWMPRLIWVCCAHRSFCCFLSCCGSFVVSRARIFDCGTLQTVFLSGYLDVENNL